MADYNKIHFDPTIFNKESYRQALETLENLQNSNAKLFLTTEDVYNEAADRGVTLHVAISAQADNSLSSKIRRFFTKEPAVSIPENAIEVQLDEKTIQYLKESIHNEDPLYLTQHLDDAMNSIYHVTDKDKVKYNNAKKEAYEDSRQHPEEVKDFLDTSDPRVQLEILKEAYELDHEVQYYIPATEVKNAATATAAANISFDSDNDFLNFISEQNIRMSEDGRIPEGAIEIKLDASLGLDPVYKPADLYDLISRHEELDHAHSGFTFASEKDREEFQKLITQALGRDKEPEKALGQAPEPQPEVKSQTPEEQANKTPGNSKEPEKTPDQQSEMKSQTMDTSDPRVQQGQREQKQSSIIADNGKINIDPMVFDEKSYRQALDLLQNPAAKFYITAKDVVRGWTNPDQRKFTYDNAADLISRWPTCVNVAIPDTPLNKIEQLFNPDLPASASAKIPDGAIEVKPGLSVIQGLTWSLDNKECLFHVDDCMWKDFSCADPKRLNDLEGLVKCVAHGLDNYPNLSREVADNKIPAFAFDQFNDIVSYYRSNNVDFTAPKKQLDALKLGRNQKYYFENTGVQEFTDGWIATGLGDGKAPDANDVLKNWTFSALRSTDGKVPEGAAEVCFKNGLKPEYRVEDVALAVDLNQIISHKNIGLPGNHRSAAMTYASEKDWNKCQAMIEKALSNIKEHEPEQKQKSHSNSNSLSR